MTGSNSRLGRTPVTVVHAPLVKSTVDNSMKRDWANATRTTYDYCSFQPFQPAGTKLLENEREREFISGFFRVWLPPEADGIKGYDRIECHGESYDVYSEPNPWRDFNDNLHHIELLVFQREG